MVGCSVVDADVVASVVTLCYNINLLDVSGFCCSPIVIG